MFTSVSAAPSSTSDNSAAFLIVSLISDLAVSSKSIPAPSASDAIAIRRDSIVTFASMALVIAPLTKESRVAF